MGLHLAGDCVESAALAELHEDVYFGGEALGTLLVWGGDVGAVADDEVGVDELGELQLAQQLAGGDGAGGDGLRGSDRAARAVGSPCGP